MRWQRIRWAGLVLIGLCAAVPVTPAEAGRWASPELVTSAGFAPSAAIGADGTAVVAWVPAVGDFGGSGIRAAIRDPAGRFSVPQDLETGVAHPELAISGDGDAFAAWQVDGVVKAAIRPAGGTFGLPQVLGTGPRYQDVSLVSNDAGDAVIVWGAADGGRMSVRPDGAPAFEPAVPARGPGRLAIDARGVISQAWVEGGAVKVARREPGGGFGAPESIEVGADFPRVDLSGHADGSLAVLIEGRVGWGDARRWVATAAPRGRFRAPEPVDLGTSVDGTMPYEPPPGVARVGALPGGRAVVATETTHWADDPQAECPERPCWTGRSDGLQIQQVDAEGRISAPVRAPGVSYAVSPALGVDLTGTAEVLFDAYDGTSAVTVPTGGDPCPARRIAPHRSIPVRPSLQAGAVGLATWQEIPSSKVHVTLYRPESGCGGDAPAEGAGERAPVAGTPATATDASADVAAPVMAASAAPAARVRLGRVAEVRRGRAALLRVRCLAGRSCAGTLGIHRSGRTLGRTSFRLAAGTAARLRVRLAVPARRALRRGAVHAVALVAVPGRPTSARRITLAP